MRCIRKRAEAKFECNFVELMQIFADQGYNRTQTAKAIGCSKTSLLAVLADMDDPFPPKSISAAFVADTGESLGEFVKRKAAEGLWLAEVSRLVGYTSPGNFKRELKNRGIQVEFAKRHCRRTAAKLLAASSRVL